MPGQKRFFAFALLSRSRLVALVRFGCLAVREQSLDELQWQVIYAFSVRDRRRHGNPDNRASALLSTRWRAHRRTTQNQMGRCP